MWKKRILIVFTLFVCNIAAQEKCRIDDDQWNTALQFEVKDVDTPDSIKKPYKSINIQGFEFDSQYVKCEFDDPVKKENLIFSLKDDFSHYVENEDKNIKSTKIHFICADGNVSKDFNLVVTQTNFSKPQIHLDKPLEFELTMPITPQTIITSVIVTVSEKNLDTRANDITFSVSGACSDEFEFAKTQKGDTRKTFYANLKTKDKVLQLDESLTCDIKVETKHGSDNAQLILKVDVKESIPPNPVFEQPLYTVIISNDNTISPLTIKLRNKIFEPSIKIISDDYKDNFIHEVISQDTIEIKSNKPLPSNAFEKDNYVSITIEASYEKAKLPGNTIIIIKGSEKTVLPVFEKLLYEGQYNNKDSLTIEEIKLKSYEAGKDIEFNIETDKNKSHFDYNKVTNKLEIKDLPDSVFEEKNYISITLIARYKDIAEISIFGETRIIIKGPKIDHILEPIFEEILYEGQYKNENSLEIGDIKLTQYEPGKEVEFRIETDLNKNYFAYNKSTNKLEIKNLPESEFKVKNYITISIIASYKDIAESSISGKTKVLIKGPESDQILEPIFEDILYEGQYKNENSLEIGEIKLIQSAPDKEVEFSIETDLNKDWFKYNKNTNKLEIKELPASVFKEKNYITLTIKASYKDIAERSISGKTKVLIKGPESDQILEPIFEDILYEGQYKNENSLEIGEIKLIQSAPDKEVEFSIETDLNKDWFKYNKNTNKLEIKELPASVFKEKNYITLTIKASYKDIAERSISGKTKVLIKGPESDQILEPIFEDILYEGQYKNENSLEIGEIKLIQSAPDKEVEFSIETDLNKDWFKYNKNTNKLEIKELPASVFKEKNYITLTIKASYKDIAERSISGKTKVLIKGPESDQILEPIFEDILYEGQYKNENSLEIGEIKLIQSAPDKEVEFSIETDLNKDWFKYNKNTNKLEIKELPASVFKEKNYITLTIKASYKDIAETSISGETKVIIKGPNANLILEPIFEKILYEGQYKNENSLEIGEIKLIQSAPDKDVEFSIETDNNKDSFNYNKDTNKLEIKNLPDSVFEEKNYVTVTIIASYEDVSGETKVIIKGPKTEEVIPIPEFEEPLYELKYVDRNTLEPDEIKLITTSTKYETTFDIDTTPDYKKYFEYDQTNHKLVMKNLPEEVILKQNIIWVTIKATYKDGTKSGYTTVLIKSSKSNDSKNKVFYDSRADILEKDYSVTGSIGIYLAASTDTKEIIDYTVEKSDISNSFSYDAEGVLNVITELPKQDYYKITLVATGQTSKSTAKMDVIIIITCNEPIFKNSLLIEPIMEEEDPKSIVNEIPGYKFEFSDTNSEGWFEIKDGKSLTVNSIDREDPRLKDMLVAQVKTKIKAVKNPASNYISGRATFDLKQELMSQQQCIDISTIENSYNEMYVVVTVGDKNDNSPVFKETGPLIVGYPNSEISEYVAPPYLVKVTATDGDTGINAKIRYSVDQNFKIDPENGIIYPSETLSSDTEFTITATDKNGAEDGNKTPLKVKVKILKQEQITILTLNNVPYNGIDTFVEELSKETGTVVKYLSSTALPKMDSESKQTRIPREVRDGDKIPTLRIVMYALDKENVLSSVDFKKKIEESSLKETVDIKEYANPETVEGDESDNSGLVAAVSTVSVLLVLVIVGIVGVYFFYLRPRLFGGPVKYERQSDSNSSHTSPVETKKQSKIIDRRPTGFPVGFKPTDLEDEEDLEIVKEEVPKRGIVLENEYSELSNNEQERKKSVVFDQNVTEIEIEISEL